MKLNVPNLLTIARIFITPIFLAVILMDTLPHRFLIACVIFSIGSITDAIDGHLARKNNEITNFGKFLDPIADKILVLSALVVIVSEPFILGYENLVFGKILGGVGVSLIVAREMAVSVLRMIAAGKGLVLAAEKVGKVKTFLTDFAILFLLISADFVIMYYVGVVLFIISVIITVYSGIFYLVKNREVFK